MDCREAVTRLCFLRALGWGRGQALETLVTQVGLRGEKEGTGSRGSAQPRKGAPVGEG